MEWNRLPRWLNPLLLSSRIQSGIYPGIPWICTQADAKPGVISSARTPGFFILLITNISCFRSIAASQPLTRGAHRLEDAHDFTSSKTYPLQGCNPHAMCAECGWEPNTPSENIWAHTKWSPNLLPEPQVSTTLFLKLMRLSNLVLCGILKSIAVYFLSLPPPSNHRFVKLYPCFIRVPVSAPE